MSVPDTLVTAAVKAGDQVLLNMDRSDPQEWPSMEEVMRAALAAAFAALPECEDVKQAFDLAFDDWDMATEAFGSAMAAALAKEFGA